MTTAWTCDGCGVRVSFAPGFADPEVPGGWERVEGGWHCLGCRREQVVKAAASMEKASATAIRKRALMEFELKRDPSAPDHVIARRVKCATRHVPPVRAELRNAGTLPSA